ncbi:MAG: dinitrogenase iron-molybdenum cofactor biosynthesis protein, partial [Desulfamplus sp.]|nr:dinitrogenase iron-molybdenum cofactor biosynthesis protein [Desulfamplus sp.]
AADAVHTRYPEIDISVRTLGIEGEQYAARLHTAGVRQIDLVVNAVNTAYLEKLYAWIRPGRKTLKNEEAATRLLQEQKKALRAFNNTGISVTVITTLYPDNNEDHVEEIARVMAQLGAKDMVIEPYRQEEGAEIFLQYPDEAMMEEARRVCSRHITLKEITTGTVCEFPTVSNVATNDSGTGNMPEPARLFKPTKMRPNIAVVSANGIDVDLHLGQARQILIYGPRADGLVSLLETRPAPESGSGAQRWLALAGKLKDCFAILTSNAGENPRKVLAGEGIRTLMIEGNIEVTVDALYGGGKKRKK